MTDAATLAERTYGLAPGAFPFESRFIDAAGARVHYIDEGRGPVLLMLHGNPTWSFMYRHLVTLLRDRFRCIAPDLPGFGLSTAPEGYDFQPAAHARAIAAFIDGLGLTRFTPVVGDWGGPIGLHYAGRHPEKIEGLVIGNTWCWPVNGDPHFELFSRAMGGPLGRRLIRRYNLFVNAMIPAGIKRRAVEPAVLQAYRRPFPTPDRRMPTYVFPRSIRYARAFLAECEAGLAALRHTPALIVWGDRDIAFRDQERRRFEATFPRHRTVVLRGAGHFICEDAPEEIATAIRAWASVPGDSGTGPG